MAVRYVSCPTPYVAGVVSDHPAGEARAVVTRVMNGIKIELGAFPLSDEQARELASIIFTMTEAPQDEVH